MLMIRTTINILPFIFTSFIICLRNLKKCYYDFEQWLFCVKRIVLIGIQLIEENKSIVNNLIKAISQKTLYKLRLTKILKNRFFDYHPITSE